MSKKLGRNDLCWCGSGKKYKKCHLNKEEYQEIKNYEIANNFKNVLKEKTCKVPDNLKHECSKKIIKAHTISKSANLKNISNNNKEVYVIDMDYMSIKSNKHTNQKLINLKLKHINQASTFYIFCQKHDKELFAPIEDKKFIFTQEQIFLLSYRVIAKLIYMKEQQLKLFENDNIDNGLPIMNQYYTQMNKHFMTNKQYQLDDLNKIKSIYDANLLNKDYSNIKYYSIIIDKIPEIMVSGGFIPFIDFYGNELFNPLESYSSSIIISSIKIDESKGAFILSWNESQEFKTSEKFINILDTFSANEKIKALTCLIFTNVYENLIISPNWYEQLDNDTKEFIYSCFVPDEQSVEIDEEQILELVDKDFLPDFFKNLSVLEAKELIKNIPNKRYDLYDYDMFGFFNWNIIEIKTNLYKDNK